MNLFENVLKFNGFPIRKAKVELNRIQQIPEERYQSYIFQKRQEIVDYHLENNSFYKNFIGSKKLSWENLPIMNKRHLQTPLEGRLSKGFTKKSVYINKTSGSSGTPFIFAKDKFCHALSWAEFFNSYGNAEIDLNNSLQARFYGIPLDFKGYFKERTKDYFSSRYRFPVFDLSEEKMEKILNSFQRKKFNYINGYTSSIVFFAKFLKAKDIILNQICPTLKRCIVTSEMLFEDDKELMESVFGVPVINEYGASELGLIAFTNNQDEFKVNCESLFVEILDNNDKAVPLGNSGRIIITSLYNKAHPMIRYEIGDIGVLTQNSTFKKPVLEKLIGRTNDMAKLPSGKIVPGLTFYYITKSVISDQGNVKEFVIEQQLLDTFKIIYVSDAVLTSKDEAKIKSAASKYLEPDLKITFERVAILKRSAAGKLRQFVSLVL